MDMGYDSIEDMQRIVKNVIDIDVDVVGICGHRRGQQRHLAAHFTTSSLRSHWPIHST